MSIFDEIFSTTGTFLANKALPAGSTDGIISGELLIKVHCSDCDEDIFMEASKFVHTKEKVDAVAAQVILQDFLDRENNCGKRSL